MPSLRAWQHIYSSVERDRSPTHTSGFQTLFYSKHGLTEGDVADIEQRVFYVSGDYNPVKRVFFRLASEKIGVGRIVPIAGRDAAGRTGLYIAHTLVFSLQDFHAAGVSPADIFSAADFVDTLDDAFSKGKADSGNIDALDIKLGPPNQPASNWPTDVFRKLVQYAINHESFSEERSALALVGSVEEIERTLAAILYLMPPQILTQCTFDTFFERGGRLGFTYCWGIGFQTRPHQPALTVVDVDKKKIIEPGKHAGVVSSFGRWIDASIVSGRQAEIRDQKVDAFLLCDYIDNQRGEDQAISALDHTVQTSVVQANDFQVKERIRLQLAASLPEVLCNRILPPVYEAMSAREKIRAMIAGLEVGHLLNQLLTCYEQTNFHTPGKPERRGLSEVLEKHENKKLEWLLLIWGDGSWKIAAAKRRIQTGLKKMDEQSYRDFWHFAVGAQLVDPMVLLVEGKEAVFSELISKNAD